MGSSIAIQLTMDGFLSMRQKNAYSKAFDQLVHTYERTISVINEVANSVVQNDPNFNAFGDTQPPTLTRTANVVDIPCRVKYLDKAEQDQAIEFGGLRQKGGISMSVKQKYGTIRIKVKMEYVPLIESATKIIVDGIECQVLYEFTAQSIFNPNYAVYYLTRQE